MSPRVFLAAIVLLLGVLPAVSAPVSVSGGEHGGFTRLVLDFDARPRWQVEKSGRGYILRFRDTPLPDFDLSRVFRLIGRDRVADIRVLGQGLLEIDLACDCFLEIEPTGQAALVVDVRPYPDLPAPAVTDAGPRIRQPDAPGESPSVPAAPAQPPEMERPAMPAGPMSDAPAGPPAAPPVARLPLVLEQLPMVLPNRPRSVAVELLGREFSRAAAQGLVAAVPEAAERQTDGMAGAAAPPGNRTNLTITTGLDRALGADRIDLPPTPGGMICLPDRSVDVAAWGDATDPAELGRYRAGAVAENGSVSPGGARDLARFYLSLGFGAEAEAAVALMTDPEEAARLRALAEIMDRGRSGSEVFAGQEFCEGKVALWAVLARPMTPAGRPTSTNFILSTFSSLPPHLRAHLGPLLSERLRAAGLEDAARVAVNAVTRGGKRTEESALATAQLDLSGTRADDARETLGVLSGGTDRTAAKALLELLRDAEARGMAPNPSWVEDAPTLVRALEGTEVAKDLNLAGLRGLIALGRFEALRDAIAETAPGLTAETRRDLAVRAIRAAAAEGSDRQFLDTEIGLARLAAPAALDRATRFAVTDRYVRMGVPDRAVRYLPADPGTEAELEIAARTLIAAGREAEAAVLLAASDDPAAPGLLGRALVSSGRDAEAIPVLASAGLDADAAEAALRIADWDWIASNAPEPLAEAARALSHAGAPPEVDPRAPNGSLIAASRRLRAQAERLLEATAPVDSPPAFTN